MAVLDKLFNFFVPVQDIEETEIIVPAPPTVYEIRPLTDKHLKEVLKLNLRCFKAGENYTKYTFNYLLSEPNCLSYRIVTPNEQMVGFVFIMMNENATGHITTIGVAPEHRRRGLAYRLLDKAEDGFRRRYVRLMRLEVRTVNFGAQELYTRAGYAVMQRLPHYYANGGDGLMMIKSLI